MAFLHGRKEARKRSGRRGTAGKLARLSAEGRRRENAALFAVLFLLFLFVGAVVSWLGISEKTETEQRFDAYGEWKAAFYDVDEARAEAFIGNPRTTRSGVSKVLGGVTKDGAAEKIEELEEITAGYSEEYRGLAFREKLGRCTGVYEDYEYNSYFGIYGLIGTIDEGFAELGRISMEEGRLPEAADEIAMSRAMLFQMGCGEELGQELSLEVLSGEGQVEERTWRLSGILSPYGGTWKTKGYPLVSAVISEESLEGFPWEPVYNVLADTDGIVGDTRFIYKVSEESMDVISRFAFNDAAYDFWGRSDDGYLWGMLLAAALAAAVTVFQIMSVQIRKRSRQVGLLKAIGATNVQLRRIFLREVTGILWKAAVPGTLLGTALVPAVLWGSGLAGKRRLYWGLDVPLLLGTVLVCCIVAWLGALLPVRRGSRIPIRGEIRPRSVRLRSMNGKKKYTAGRIAAGRGQGGFRLTTVLCLAAAASSVFLALYQGGKEMAPYRNGENALHYQLVYHSVMDRYAEDSPLNNTVLEQFSRIPGVGGVYTRKNGVRHVWDFYISYEGVEDCELEQLRRNWEISPYSYAHDLPYKKKDGLAMAHLMGIYSGWEPNMEGLSELVTEGTFDREAFESGEEVLLFLPPWRERDNRARTGDMDRLETNTDKRYRDFYEMETCVKPGDTITLVVDGQDMNGVGESEYDGVRRRTVTVGGIIRYLPEDKENVLWDEDYTGTSGAQYGNDVLKPYTVVADGRLVSELRSLRTEMLEERDRQEMESAGEEESLEIYAMNWESERREAEAPFEEIELVCDTSVSETTLDSIESLAETCRLNVNGPGLDAYEMWKTGYKEASNRTLMYQMAAVAAVFVFACLLLQNVNERLAEDRRRLGIFQALGVRRQEMAKGYGRKGFGNGLAALLLAHGVLLFSAVWQSREAAAALSPYRFINEKEASLYRFYLRFGGYDWKWHILVCILVLAFSTALYVMPLRGVLKNSPAENIRELGE